MPPADLDLLFQLRLVVARVGESDNAKWWGADGVLGSSGAFVYERIAPRTTPFARARVAFAVARARCASVVGAPGLATLWALPSEVEEAFEDRWALWLDEPGAWRDTFGGLEELTSSDLLSVLADRGLIKEEHVAQARDLCASAPTNAVELPGPRPLDADTLRLLAAAFACGRPAALTVPFCRLPA